MEDDDGEKHYDNALLPIRRRGSGSHPHRSPRGLLFFVYGDIGDDEWELRLGVDRVFWGVVESRPLVDIVNQTDLVENPNEKTKMGQPMVHLTWSGDWGALEVFGITWHRERTFPGRRGRLRAGPVVDHDLTSYESGAEEWHLDFAGRYSSTFRAARCRAQRVRRHQPGAHPSAEAGRLRTRSGAVLRADHPIRPGYPAHHGALASQVGGHYTAPTFAEPPARSVHFQYEEEDYAAFIVGGEYTIYAVWDSDADHQPDWRMGPRRARPMGDQRVRERYTPGRASRV